MKWLHQEGTNALRSYLESKEDLLNGPSVLRYGQINSMVDKRDFLESTLPYGKMNTSAVFVAQR